MQQIYNEQTFSCGLCKKTFKKEGFLLRHFFNHSAGVKLLACKKYAYSIVESCLLKKHNFLVRKRRKQERLALKLQKAESLITDRILSEQQTNSDQELKSNSEPKLESKSNKKSSKPGPTKSAKFTYSCVICHKPFNYRKSLYKHESSHCSKTIKIIIPHCDKSSRSVSPSNKIISRHTKTSRKHKNLENLNDEILGDNFEIEYTNDAEIDHITDDHENSLVTVNNVDELLETSDEDEYESDNEKSPKENDISKLKNTKNDIDITNNILIKSDLETNTSDYLVSILDEDLFIKDEPLDIEENKIDQFNHIENSHNDFKPNNIFTNTLLSKSKVVKKAKSSPLREVWMVSPLKKPNYLVKREKEDTLPQANSGVAKNLFEIVTSVGNDNDNIVTDTEITESNNYNLKTNSNVKDLENNVLNEKEVLNSPNNVQTSVSLSLQETKISPVKKQDSENGAKNDLKCTQCSAKFNQLIQLERHQFAHFLDSVDSVKEDENSFILESREKFEDKKIQESQNKEPLQITSDEYNGLLKCPVRSCNVVMTSQEATSRLGANHLMRVHALLPTKLKWIQI